MTPLFNKLNLKQQKEVVVLNAPQSFEAELAALTGITLKRELTGLKQIKFLIAFITKQQDLDVTSQAIVKQIAEDGIIWIAYPKGTSKHFSCEFNRDKGWHVFEKNNYQGVRMVAIDRDWSALRLRHMDYINR